MTLFLLGVNSARAKFYEGTRAVKHRLDEPGQLAAGILAENQGR